MTNWLIVLLVLALIVGLVWFREYVSDRAAEDRHHRESRD